MISQAGHTQHILRQSSSPKSSWSISSLHFLHFFIFIHSSFLMPTIGFEPITFWLQTRCTSRCAMRAYGLPPENWTQSPGVTVLCATNTLTVNGSRRNRTSDYGTWAHWFSINLYCLINKVSQNRTGVTTFQTWDNSHYINTLSLG